MSKRFAIETIHEFQLAKEDLKDRDQDCVAALAALSYAISEINFLLRTYLFVEYDFDGPEHVDTINLFQRNVMMRIVSAKLFEAANLVNLQGKSNQTSSTLLKQSFRKFQVSYRHLVSHSGYSLARTLRNEATNHCCLAPARKNLGALPGTADFSMLFHQMEGNCLYVIGETVMHYGRVLRHSSSNDKRGAPGSRSEFDLWMHWNLCTLRWLRRAHRHLMSQLVSDDFLARRTRQRTLWLPEASAGVPGKTLTPMFVRKAQ